MSERLSLDRRSFKQFLSTLFQQIPRQGLRGSLDYRIDPQFLPELIQIRKEVKGGRFDLNAFLTRLTKLAQRVLGASGVGVWLFTRDEVFLYAGAGTASNDERLRLEVISKLASACNLGHDSAAHLANRTAILTDYDACGLGDFNSLLVEPIHQGQNVAGAFAALSDECNAFTKRDVANFHRLADLLAQAISKAAEEGLQESFTLEPAAIRQLIERLIPGLQRMLESDLRARHSNHPFVQKELRHELPGAGVPTKSFQDLHKAGEKAGATQVLGGTRTGDGEEPSALGASASYSPLQEIGSSRLGAWPAWKSKLSEMSKLWPGACQEWERTVALARSYWTTVGQKGIVQRGLGHARDSIRHAIQITNTRLRMLPESRSSMRTLLKMAPVIALLAIVIMLVRRKMGPDTPPPTSVLSSETSARESTLITAKSEAREAPVAGRFVSTAVIEVSHMHITDRATEIAVRTLSRYELAGLRRRAELGDDSAAFEMGMAYEIGRAVPQQCATAAQWVARAAGEHNAAAQYNLGLRYREGDGVAMDEDEALKWLQKAAARQNSEAQAAIGVLAAHHEGIIPSSSTSH